MITMITDEEFERVKQNLIGYSQAQKAGYRPVEFTYMTGLEWLDEVSKLTDPDCLIEKASQTPFAFRDKATKRTIWVIQPTEEDKRI